MPQDEVEYVTPENKLMKKAGTGGLSASVIESAQKAADTITVDVTPFAHEKITTLKQYLKENDVVNQHDQNSIDDILHILVPLNVNAKLAKNTAVSQVSGSLLTFTEALSRVNIDSQHVIEAHIKTMEIILAKDITDSNDAVSVALYKELQDAITRYNSKYKAHNDQQEKGNPA